MSTVTLGIVFLCMLVGSLVLKTAGETQMPQAPATVPLPPPRLDSSCSVERALHTRRTTREFSNQAITLGELSQLLWAAQGITSPEGFRTAPSAGALYPLEVSLTAGNVEGLGAGIYRYVPETHRLTRTASGDVRSPLASAALGQDWFEASAAVLVFATVEQRTTRKYGTRGGRYIHIEVGHAAQNVALQAVCLGLATAVVGAFDDTRVGELMKLPPGEQPLYLMPVGRSE